MKLSGILLKSVEESFENVDVKYNHIQFSGEASDKEIERLTDEGSFGSDVVIGLGAVKHSTQLKQLWISLVHQL